MSNKPVFMYHPACSKTPKTRVVLEGVEYEERDLTQSMLTKEEVMAIASALDVRVQDLLRPASPVYVERKDELYAMEDADLAAVIATEPTLIKRPIVKTDKGYVIGLDEEKICELVGKEA